jgi:methionyl-tRNA synthetase
MVLASSNDNGIYIISPDEGAEPGQRVKWSKKTLLL